MYFFEYLTGTTKLSKAKKMLHSKINYFGEFIRSVIEAKSSYAGKVFMLEKVLMLFMLEGITIAILLNTLISIKDYAKSCQRKFIHCLAHENI